MVSVDSKLFQEIQVVGASIKSVVDGLGAFQSIADQVLRQHGLENPREDLWYPFDQWIGAFSSLSSQLGPATLFQIGQKITKDKVFPSHVNSLKAALTAIDVAYQMNQRGAKPGQIGNYFYTETGENSVTIISNTPFPCDFDRGIIVAMANKFRGATRITVEHEPGSCRKSGQPKCFYRIDW